MRPRTAAGIVAGVAGQAIASTMRIAATFLLLVAAPFAAAAQIVVPYVPTPPAVVEAMLDLADIQRGEYLIDLGSGDGRIPVAAAARGARALGVDLDRDLVAAAVLKAKLANAEGVRFRRQDLFATPLREADVVTLYLLRSINLKLRPRLLTELRPGTRIVSHGFDMDDWRPDRTEEIEGSRVFLWIVPAPVAGRWRDAATGATLSIDQRFQDVSGTIESGGRSVPLTDATLEGDRLRFTAALPQGTLRFEGRAIDDRIEAEGGGRRFQRIE